MELSATGNIYCDGFWDDGKYYRNYTVDCAVCGQEQYLASVGKHKRSETNARQFGWTMDANRKWYCPKHIGEASND